MKSFDLNLLPQLHALLLKRNVTKAAEEMHMSQPAMSAALSKLRRHFDDELLVRSGRSFVLTPLATDLLPLVEVALEHTTHVTQLGADFDPATSDRQFVIAASDYAASMLVSRIHRILAVEAPHTSVDVVPTEGNAAVSDSVGQWDLVVGPVGYDFPGASKQVFRDSFVAVVDAAHPLLKREEITLADLAALDHAVGMFGPKVRTPADRMWDALGHEVNVAAHVTGLLSLPLLIEGTRMVGLVPRMLAHRIARAADIVVLDFPLDDEPVLVEAMYWHPGRTEDKANTWLRQTVQRAAAGLHELLELELRHPVRHVVHE